MMRQKRKQHEFCCIHNTCNCKPRRQVLATAQLAPARVDIRMHCLDCWERHVPPCWRLWNMHATARHSMQPCPLSTPAFSLHRLRHAVSLTSAKPGGRPADHTGPPFRSTERGMRWHRCSRRPQRQTSEYNNLWHAIMLLLHEPSTCTDTSSTMKLRSSCSQSTAAAGAARR